MILFPKYEYKLQELRGNEAYIKIQTNSKEELGIIASFISKQMFIKLEIIDIALVMHSVEVFSKKEDETEIDNYQFYSMAIPAKGWMSLKSLEKTSGFKRMKIRFCYGRKSYTISVNIITGEITHL